MTGMCWGGSEELWYRSARQLLDAGHQIAVNFKWWPKMSYQLGQLQERGAEITLRDQPPSFWQKKAHEVRTLLSPKSLPTTPRRASGELWLKQVRPDAVLITIGYHPDPMLIAAHCHDAKIPYAINVQCASNAAFIHGDRVNDFRHWYKNARRVFFVSAENQHKVEMNLAMPLSNAEIVCNPFNLKKDHPAQWPSDNAVYRLACVGRIHFQSKGQDLLVDLMRRQPWRDRPICIHFYGHDQGNRRQLEELIRMHGLENKLKLEGFTPDITKIWSENHGLILPSRYEGAALVVVEAMLSNRMVIVTDTGRNRELIDDGESGFIAHAATVELLDEALERAWQKRDQWEVIGRTAGCHIRERFSADPAGEFAQRLLSLS
jgi:glycosyltransferase involved in cell wall biosynthesis